MNFLVEELENLRCEEVKTDLGFEQKPEWGKQAKHAIDAFSYVVAMITKPFVHRPNPAPTAGPVKRFIRESEHERTISTVERADISEEPEGDAAAPKSRPFWTFLNSNFGLWLLSALFVTGDEAKADLAAQVKELGDPAATLHRLPASNDVALYREYAQSSVPVLVMELRDQVDDPIEAKKLQDVANLLASSAFDSAADFPERTAGYLLAHCVLPRWKRSGFEFLHCTASHPFCESWIKKMFSEDPQARLRTRDTSYQTSLSDTVPRPASSPPKDSKLRR